tara:strand:- start:356 stop:523 length:168 start_codon:yes stop_codon:yes gene_type:complete
LARDYNYVPLAPILPFKLPPIHLTRFSIKKKIMTKSKPIVKGLRSPIPPQASQKI